MLTEELIQQFHKFSEKGKAYDCIDARIANHIIENNDLMVISGIPYYYANYVGSDALFEFEESGWRFIRCGDLPEDCTYKGEVACMGDLPDNPSVGDFYSVKNLDGKVKTVYFAHGWKELGREV